MTLIWLKASLKTWRSKLKFRTAKLKRVRTAAHAGSGVVTDAEAADIKKLERMVDEAERKIAQRQSEIAKKSRGKIRAGGQNRGTEGVVDSLRQIGGQGLTRTSAKRQNRNPFSGRGSDHDHRNTDAWANDLSNGSSPTPEMDEAAYRMMRAIGFKNYRKGTPINVNQGIKTLKINGGMYRVQIIYRGSGPNYGGNHLHHIHVGVKRVG